jgi:dTDP-4-dehydrorhamnose 3,5-epimerase
MNHNFEFCPCSLLGVYKILPFYAPDERGGLLKDYNFDIYRQQGIDFNIHEIFHTISKKGVIRAIHFQLGRQQAKIVRCISGKIFDVVVDLRTNSPTFGNWEGFELTGENQIQLLIPEYFGHGYLVIEDSIVSYTCNAGFYKDGDSGIIYNDSDIGIEWPFHRIGGIENLIISEKDQKLMSLKEYYRM